jgi:septation ring formation regulator EzrA
MKKWEDLSGKNNTLEILEKFKEEKEALIFEIENSLGQYTLEETGADVLRRIELHILKQKLQKNASLLDKDISKEEEKNIETEIENIQKRIKEISS